MRKQKNASKGSSMPARQVRDVSNRNILRDPVLCLQFLKDYVDETLFKDLKPEDIEDESEKYQAYLGVTFETDTVKKIRMSQEEENVPLYLISLVEHKSRVDYNISMQILRYMTCIWNEYGKEMMSLKKGDIRNKSFCYPPILPIVYYEGKEPWTADLYLKDRIMMNELFESYIPNFTYKLVRSHDYSNEELLKNEDEMSLLMMLGKAQTPEDLHRLVNAEKEKVDVIVQKAPVHTLELIADTVWSLCMKLNVSQGEAEQCVRKVRERQMGYWFENIEKMDIQAERRNTAKARAELEKTKQKLDMVQKEAEEAQEKARKEIDEARKETDEARKETEEVRKAAEKSQENTIKTIVNIQRKHGLSRKQAVEEVMDIYHFDIETAEAKVDQYWDEQA